MKNNDGLCQMQTWERQSLLILIKDLIYSVRYSVAFSIWLSLFNEDTNTTASLFGWTLVIVSFLWSITSDLSSWLSTKFAINTDGLRLQTGFYNKHTHFIPSENFHELQVSQTWLLRLLGLYHVEWSVHGDSEDVFSLTGLNKSHLHRLQGIHLDAELAASDVPLRRILAALAVSKWTNGAVVPVLIFIEAIHDVTFLNNILLSMLSYLIENVSSTLIDIASNFEIHSYWLISLVYFSFLFILCATVYAMLWVIALGLMALKMYPQRACFTSSALSIKLGMLLPQYRIFHLPKVQQISVLESWLGSRVPWMHIKIQGTSGNKDERGITLLANMPDQLNEKIKRIFNRTWHDVQFQSWNMQSLHWWRLYQWFIFLDLVFYGTASAGIMWYNTENVMWFTWIAIVVFFLMWLSHWMISKAQCWHSHAFDDDYVYLRRGYLKKRWVIIPWESIQKIEWRLTPHATKHGYTKIILHTLELKEKIELMGVASEYAETFRKEWLKHCR